MKKADYSKIAPSYDRGRSLSEQNIALWLDIMAKYARAPAGARLLDLGCGTGRFAIPIATKLHFNVTGADSSKEMLAKAREKDAAGRVKWDLEDAQSLTYPDESYDIVFMSHLLHHVSEPGRVILECRRVLTSGGAIMIRYADFAQIRNDVEHTLFPETIAIDEARLISIEKIENWLTDASFSSVVSEEVIQRTFATGKAHLEAAMLKNTSTLTMISPQAFAEGINNLKKYIEKNPNDPWLWYDRMTLTVGYKTPIR